MIFGTDISKHQGTVDFEDMRIKSDMMFSIVKCTEGAEEGTPFIDPKFKENWEKLIDLPPDDPDKGMYRGAYHFARYDNRQDQGEAGGENEAKWFCKVLKEVGHYGKGCLPPAIDLEIWEGIDQNNLAFVRGFIRVVEAELGRSPMFYTGVNVWYYKFADSDEFIDYPLWEVKYQNDGWSSIATPPQMTKENGDWPWSLWQWSGGGEFNYYDLQYGSIAGVPSGVADVNRYDGTYEEMGHVLATPFLVGEPGLPPQLPSRSDGASPLVIPDEIDLDTLRGKASPYVARVQGLLLGHGYGPDGLVGSNGLPDGKFGDRTRDCLGDFKSKLGLPGGASVMTLGTWNELVVSKLSLKI